jgi:hypothetical protein
MEQKNYIMENFFTDEEKNILINFINDNYGSKDIQSVSIAEVLSGQHTSKVRIEPYTGRARMEFAPNDPDLPLPKEIKDKVDFYAHQVDPNIYLESCYFVEYNKKFGIPKLDPHVDNHPAFFTMDYQLESNTPWALLANGEEFTLEDNQAFVMDTNSQVHWREPRLFHEGQFVKMIFFHFSDGTRKVLDKQTRQNKSEFWEQEYFEKMRNLGLSS